LAPVIAQIGRVGVNSSCFPGTELGAQVPVRSAAAILSYPYGVIDMLSPHWPPLGVLGI
jgi:hypothetical protein